MPVALASPTLVLTTWARSQLELEASKLYWQFQLQVTQVVKTKVGNASAIYLAASASATDSEGHGMGGPGPRADSLAGSEPRRVTVTPVTA